MEYKEEINAVVRAKKPKIKTKEKYLGQTPGKLNLSVNYNSSRRILTVAVKSANNLYGRRSQDPYALCYLHKRGEEKSWFQAGNEKTVTLDKTLDPEWNTTFQFEINNDVDFSDDVSLIISIWDEDSDSKDDYMAGIRIKLNEVQYFENRGVVEVELQHQDIDGHPCEPSEHLWWRKVFGYAWMEYKEEYNACGRFDQKKIRGPDSFKLGQTPGSLTLSLKYLTDDILEVYIDSAKSLYGKRSQDPYAFCYLHERGERKSWFQVGNNKTDTKDKTLEPVWKHTFKLKMKMTDLSRKCLVIAIWDKDSTTRDDYMAGIRINLRDIHQFDFRRGLVTVQLMAQDATDGHPLETNVHYWRSGMDLKTCNNNLVAFIERARVLAEAIEVKRMYPNEMNNRQQTSVQFESMIKQEMLRMRNEIENRKIHLEKIKRDQRELTGTKRGYETNYEQLKVTLQTLCSTKCGILVDRQHISMNTIHLPDVVMPKFVERYDKSSQYQEMIERRIRIITEYEKKMKLRLSEVRMTYSEKYQTFIVTLRSDSEKIMSLYEELIRLRIAKNPGYRDGLLELETRRNYGSRIETLNTDINSIDEALRILREKLARMEGEWMSQIRPLDDQLAARKVQLREMLMQMVAFAESKYTVTNEVAIYEKLLTSEEQRLRGGPHPPGGGGGGGGSYRTVTVRRSEVRGGGSVGGGDAGFDGFGGGRNSLPRRPDSGFFSP